MQHRIDLRKSIDIINAWPAIRNGWLNLLVYTAFCSLFMTIIILGTKNSTAASGSLFAISNSIKDLIIDEYGSFLSNVSTLVLCSGQIPAKADTQLSFYIDRTVRKMDSETGGDILILNGLQTSFPVIGIMAIISQRTRPVWFSITTSWWVSTHVVSHANAD